MISAAAIDDSSDGGFSDVLHSLALCHPDTKNAAPLTLDSQDFDKWRTEIFRAHIWPAIVQAWNFSANGQSQELAAADRTLDSALSAIAAGRSRAEGSTLLAAHRPPAAERWLDRYSRLVATGRAPAHLAIVMAARGAAFRIAPRMVAAAYLVLELRAWKTDEASLREALAICLADAAGPGVDLMAA